MDLRPWTDVGDPVDTVTGPWYQSAKAGMEGFVAKRLRLVVDKYDIASFRKECSRSKQPYSIWTSTTTKAQKERADALQ